MFVRKSRSIVTALGIALVASAQAWGRETEEAASRQVREAVRGIIAADNALDLERVLGAYAEDAVLLPAGTADAR